MSNERKIVTPERLDALRRASVRNMPDDPTRRGMKPADIKDRMAKPTEMVAEWLGEMEDEMGTGGTGGGTGNTTVTVGGKEVSELAFDSDPQDQIDALKESVADLLYEIIQITSFTSSVTQAEKGQTVDSVRLSWRISRTPTALTLDGAAISVTSTEMALAELGLKENKIWTLSVKDERGGTDTRIARVNFLSRVYWGVATAPAAINSAFVLGLDGSTLASTRTRTIAASADEGQYIWYAVPASMGTCVFWCGGLEGGFTPTEIQCTNAYGHTEAYVVWRSENASLGNTVVEVK